MDAGRAPGPAAPAWADHPASAVVGSLQRPTRWVAGGVVGKDELDARALLHNLADADYGRPLDELRDLFWNAPRMPLLPSGDADLQRAIFEAVTAGSLRLVGSDGLERAITRAGEIGIGSAALRLARAEVSTHGQEEGDSGDIKQQTSSRTVYPTSPDVQLKVSLNTNLEDSGRRWAVFKLLDELAAAVDSREATHIQVAISVVVPEAKAAGLTTRAQATGGTASSTPLE